MRAASRVASHGVARSHTARVELSVLLPALVALIVGALIQGQTYLNHDVAWVLYSSERLLQGGTFGREIVAANPPLIWWLNAPIAGLAGLLGSDPIDTFRAVIVLSIGISLVATDRMFASIMSRPSRIVFVTGLALLLTLGAGQDFGQREQIAVILCLPWLQIMAGQAQGLVPDRTKAALVGIAAGIGFCFKPHFLAVPVLVGLYAAIRRKSMRPLFGIESLAIVLTCVVYVCASWFFARPYLTEVVPLISQTYWGFSHSLSYIVLANPGPIALCVMAVATARHHQAVVFALASCGYLVAALVQAKGYTYHFFPVTSLALISLALSTLTVATSHRNRWISGFTMSIGLGVMAMQSASSLGDRMVSGDYGTVTTCLTGMVQEYVPEGGGFMAFSTHPYPGFPIANYSKRRWVAATNSRLFLPAIVHLRAQGHLSPRLAEVLALAESAEHAAALKDMAQQPALVLVDAREKRHAIGTAPIDFTAFYSEDPAFARVWANYHEIHSCAPGIRAFRRIGET